MAMSAREHEMKRAAAAHTRWRISNRAGVISGRQKVSRGGRGRSSSVAWARRERTHVAVLHDEVRHRGVGLRVRGAGPGTIVTSMASCAERGRDEDRVVDLAVDGPRPRRAMPPSVCAAAKAALRPVGVRYARHRSAGKQRQSRDAEKSSSGRHMKPRLGSPSPGTDAHDLDHHPEAQRPRPPRPAFAPPPSPPAANKATPASASEPSAIDVPGARLPPSPSAGAPRPSARVSRP